MAAGASLAVHAETAAHGSGARRSAGPAFKARQLLVRPKGMPTTATSCSSTNPSEELISHSGRSHPLAARDGDRGNNDNCTETTFAFMGRERRGRTTTSTSRRGRSHDNHHSRNDARRLFLVSIYYIKYTILLVLYYWY